MHHAPSVSYPVGRCAFQRAIWVALTGITGAVMLVWCTLQTVSWPMCFSGIAAVFGILLGWRSLHTQTGTLNWDGQVWCWHSRGGDVDDTMGEVFVVFDTQDVLVLRWQPTSGRLASLRGYVWLDQESATQHWLNLRCAVYNRSRPLFALKENP